MTRVVSPRIVNLTFASKPSGRTLSLEGTTFAAPRTWTSWKGWDVTVDAPVQPGYTFQSWSEGGARSHTIRTPATATTYKATLRKAPRGGG